MNALRILRVGAMALALVLLVRPLFADDNPNLGLLFRQFDLLESRLANPRGYTPDQIVSMTRKLIDLKFQFHEMGINPRAPHQLAVEAAVEPLLDQRDLLEHNLLNPGGYTPDEIVSMTRDLTNLKLQLYNLGYDPNLPVFRGGSPLGPQPDMPATQDRDQPQPATPEAIAELEKSVLTNPDIPRDELEHLVSIFKQQFGIDLPLPPPNPNPPAAETNAGIANNAPENPTGGSNNAGTGTGSSSSSRIIGAAINTRDTGVLGASFALEVCFAAQRPMAECFKTAGIVGGIGAACQALGELGALAVEGGAPLAGPTGLLCQSMSAYRACILAGKTHDECMQDSSNNLPPALFCAALGLLAMEATPIVAAAVQGGCGVLAGGGWEVLLAQSNAANKEMMSERLQPVWNAIRDCDFATALTKALDLDSRSRASIRLPFAAAARKCRLYVRCQTLLRLCSPGCRY